MAGIFAVEALEGPDLIDLAYELCEPVEGGLITGFAWQQSDRPCGDANGDGRSAMAQKIMITGASGFVGQTLVRQLAREGGFEILELRRSKPKTDAREVVVADLLAPNAYSAALKGVSAVVHLAAVTGKASPAEYQRVNEEGTRAVVDACKLAEVPNIIHVSTIAAAYPNQRYYPYAQSKARAEDIVRESGLNYAIIRPTLVLGEASPIWLTLSKIAKAPVIPFPSNGEVAVQPVDVSAVAEAIAIVLKSERFSNEVFEIGGPDSISFKAFLSLIHKAYLNEEPRIVDVPLGPIRLMLAAMEPVLRPLMPATAGQLAVFANDSTVEANWLHDQLKPNMPSTEALVRRLVEAETTSSNDGAPPILEKPARAENPRAVRQECDTFVRYLTGRPPSEYVRAQYLKGVEARGLANDQGFTEFDQASLRLARRGPVAARLADAHCAFFRRRGALRRKLILLLAVLEHVSPSNAIVDDSANRGPFMAILGLIGAGIGFGVCSIFGALALAPAYAGFGSKQPSDTQVTAAR